MITTRRFPMALILFLGVPMAAKGVAWATVVFALYAKFGIEYLRIPFLPIGTVGTAVAFYVGFKNNSSYDRFWEGRKIWGGVVNASRTWAAAVLSYIDPGRDDPEATGLRRRLIYRHLAYINAVRLQLRKSSRFYNQPAKATKRRLEKHSEVMRNDWDAEIGRFLDPEEHAQTKAMANPATHLMAKQGAELRDLVKNERLDLFHQIAMMETITEMYTLQGKCERIKNTPFPRLYAEYSRVFTRVFVFLVPFGLLDVFAEDIRNGVTALEHVLPAIPMLLTAGLITWVFSIMEAIGDATEDPFERSMSDVPMNALCRTIEVDLRQLLGESDEMLPPKELSHDHVLY